MKGCPLTACYTGCARQHFLTPAGPVVWYLGACSALNPQGHSIMNTHLMTGIALVLIGLIGIAAMRDLLRMRRAQLQPASLRSSSSRRDAARH